MKTINKIPLFLMGTVRLKLTGDYCERLINILAANNISFWDFRKVGKSYCLTILKKDIFKIRFLRRNTFVKIKIIDKKGLPFFVNKYNMRYGMICGILLFIFLLSFMSTRLWVIKINGDTSIGENEILSKIYDMGIIEGISMNSIDTAFLKQNLIISSKDIAWSSFNKQGCILEVNFTKANTTDDEKIASNLIAETDAVIKKVNVQKGTAMVKIGDTVKKGQLLVSGTVDYGNGSVFETAKGEIIAEVHTQEKINIEKTEKTAVVTGKNVTKSVVNLFGIDIPLYLGSLHGDYEKHFEKENVKLFGGITPISIYKCEFMEIFYTYKELNAVSAKEKAIELLLSEYKANGYEVLKITNEKIIEKDGLYELTAEVVSNKNIAERKYLELTN